MSDNETNPKKGKAIKKMPKISAVDRTFYELTITDLNKKLARLTGQYRELENEKIKLRERVKVFEENQEATTNRLYSLLTKRNDELSQRDNLIEEMKITHVTEKNNSIRKYRDLEEKYTSMHHQLSAEIQLLQGQVNALLEFKRLRNILCDKYDEVRAEETQRYSDFERHIFRIQQQVLFEKERLKTDLDTRLLRLSQEFIQSTDTRNAAYANRLVRENVALQRELQLQLDGHLEVQGRLEKHIAETRHVTEENIIRKDLQDVLIRNNQNKLNIIEKLMKKYEKLKVKYMEALRFRKLYESMMEEAAAGEPDMKTVKRKFKQMAQKIQCLNFERGHLLLTVDQLERENMSMKRTIERLKFAIDQSILGKDKVVDKTDQKWFDMAGTQEARTNLLVHLVDIIQTHSLPTSQKSSGMTFTSSEASMYLQGNAGFVRSQRQMMSMFQTHRPVCQKLIISPPQFEKRSKEAIIIPKERKQDLGSIFDVEWGTPLYATSAYEENVEPENYEEEVFEGESSSSSGASVKSVTERPSTQIESEEEGEGEATGNATEKTLSMDDEHEDDENEDVAAEEWSAEMFY